MDDPTTPQNAPRRGPKRWKVALTLVGLTAASLGIVAGEASAATTSNPTSIVATKGPGPQSFGVKW